MSDLSTLPQTKDLALRGAIGLLLTLAGILAADNRRVIFKLEDRVAVLEKAFYSSTAERLTRIEGEVQSLRREKERWRQQKDE